MTSSPISRCKTRCSFLVWLGFHLALFLLFLATLLVRPSIGVTNNLFELIPTSEEMQSVSVAERTFSDRSSRTALFFVISPDFGQARETALLLEKRLLDTDAFLGLEASAGSMVSVSELNAELSRLKFALLDEETESALRQGRYQDVADSALALAYGAFPVQSLAQIDKDPFLLSEREGRSLVSRLALLGGMGPKDGVLAKEVEGSWYVMLQGELTEKAVAMNNKRDIASIFRICEELEKEAGVQVALSGIPFHSWESSMSAQRELVLITSVSLILVLLLFLWLFRSPLVILLLFGDIVLASLSAMAGVFSAFGTMNVLTLVFGTTLIGTCVDYSVHYALHAWWDGDGRDFLATRNRLFKSIGTSFLSTLLCYALLLLAPYRLLKEVALFSMAGLASSFVTSMFLYPVLFNYRHFARKGVDAGSFRVLFPDPSARRRRAMGIAAALFAVLFSLLLLPKVRVRNDLASLYRISDRMRRNEALAAKAMPYASSTYTIVSAGSEEELLAREEAFVSDLREQGAGTPMASCMVVPSARLQEERVALVRSLYEAGLQRQCEALGCDATTAWDELETLTRAPVSVGDVRSLPIARQLVDRLWVGKMGGSYYSAVMVLDADLARVEEIAGAHEGVWFFNMARDISRQLDVLTGTILRILLCSFVLMVLLLGCIYGFRRSLGYHLSPVVVLLVTVGGMVLFEGAVDFFTVVALVLSVGLGLDYVVFMMEMKGMEERKRSVSFVAVAFSFATSALSFGTLVFSSFRPVHLFGLAVLVGLCTAYLFALFMRRVDGRKEA